jgi:hypothetical protein
MKYLSHHVIWYVSNRWSHVPSRKWVAELFDHGKVMIKRDSPPFDTRTEAMAWVDSQQVTLVERRTKDSKRTLVHVKKSPPRTAWSRVAGRERF